MTFFFNGDFRFFWKENIVDFATIPQAWDSSLNTGLGQPQLHSLWITSYFNLTSFLSKFGLNWIQIETIFWILPAILLSFLLSFYLFKTLFKLKTPYSILSGIIYTLNTYFLMILTGGQLGVSLSYSIAPLVLSLFIKLINNSSLKLSLLTGLVLALQLVLDPRIVYLTLISVFIYSIFFFNVIKKIKNKNYLLIPFFISILLNSFWIFPLILTGNSSLPQGFGSTLGFEFFSFADFSHAASFLHPNFPENIFGKIYFLRSEFLILPILAFSSLLFKKRRETAYFALLGLTGIFLAKGVNEPFGQINIWLFDNFPGMSIFRDPTKFYLLIALSYSVLIPLSVHSIGEMVKRKIKISNFKFFRFHRESSARSGQISNLFLLFTVFYLIFLIRPLWLGEQREMFRLREIPKEYVQLEDFLATQSQFFRTLWIPQWQRFGFFSNNHPAIGREEILKGDYRNQIEKFSYPNSQYLLQDLSVKYVIVPHDSEGEIFLSDRRYDDELYQDTVSRLEGISFLKKIDGFGKIAVFENKLYKDHFWSPSTTLSISYEYVSPTHYIVQVENANKGDLLVFSEGYDKNWTIEIANFKVKSVKHNESFNSFVLPEGSYDLKVYYGPQIWVNIGLITSGVTLLVVLGFLGIKKFKKQ